jgi:hypothetical protein
MQWAKGNEQYVIDNTCHAGHEAKCHPELVEGSNK